MREGWIKLHRNILNWEWYTDIPVRVLWEHLLLIANYEPNRYRGVEIGVGELTTSLDKLAKDTGLTIRQVRTALDKLENSKNLTRKPTNKYTHIIVHNYSFYQDTNAYIDKQNGKQMTNERQTNDKQMTTIKNIRNKEIKEIKNNNCCSQTLIDFYISEIGKLTPNTLSCLDEYKEDGFDEELIMRAISIASDSGKRNFSYIRGILKNWEQKEIFTIRDLEEKETTKTKKQLEDEAREARNQEAIRKFLEGE